MCTTTLFIRPKSLLGMSYDVPCGKCLECRSLSQNSWVTRLGFDLKDLYENGGVAIFLTFTYNELCLPKCAFLSEVEVPCFSRDNVLTFFNKLKVSVNRQYGKGMYKYFFCSEYGKFTQRPHYHGLFMLQQGVDSTWFAEKCRALWQHGFMFPRYKDGRYIDNLGAVTSVELRNLNAACKYVSKYITKDLDYYELPQIKDYIENRDFLNDDMRNYFNGFLPLWLNQFVGSFALDWRKRLPTNVTSTRVEVLAHRLWVRLNNRFELWTDRRLLLRHSEILRAAVKHRNYGAGAGGSSPSGGAPWLSIACCVRAFAAS